MSDTSLIGIGEDYTRVITTGAIGPPGPKGDAGPTGASGVPGPEGSLPYFYIENYGGAGDFDGSSGTDNIPAFNEALAEAVAIGYGVIAFGPGVFRFSSEAWISGLSNIHVMGSGIGVTTIVIDHSPNVRAFRFLNSNVVSISDLTVTNKTQGTTRVGNPAVEFSGCSVFECKNVEVAHVSNQAAIWAGNTSTFGFIHYNLVHDTLADGIHTASAGCSFIICEDNVVYNTGDDCIAITSDGGVPNSFITVTNNAVENSGANGISVYGGHDILIETNQINNTFLSGIQLYGSYSAMYRVKVKNNDVVGGGSYVTGGEGVGGYPGGITIWADIYYASDDIEISGNTIQGGRCNFIRLAEHFSTTKLLGRVRVIDNTCIGPVTPTTLGDINGGAEAGGSTQAEPNFNAGILINQVSSAEVCRNTVRQAYAQGIFAPQTTTALGVSGALVVCDNFVDDCCQGSSNIGIELGSSTEIVCSKNSGWDPNNHLAFGISWYGTAAQGLQTFSNNNVYGKPNFGVPQGVLAKNSGYTVSSPGALVIDANTGSDIQIVLQANVTSSSITNPRTGQWLCISILQDSTGGRTFVWPSNVKLSGPTPLLTSTPFAYDTFIFRYDGTNWIEMARSMDVGFSRHLVGGSGEPAFQNSWVNFGGEYSVASFWKDANGRVHLSGLVKNGTANTVIFNLPAGFRPSGSLIFEVASGTGAAQLYIAGPTASTPGNVQPVFGANTYVSLAGVSFVAEA